jgi:hypothetical protein
MDTEVKEAIEEMAGAIGTSVLAAVAVGVAGMVIKSLVVTDVEDNALTGKKELHPTKDEVAVSSVDTAATETEGKVAQDTVAGVNGEVKATETEARAATGEATAADSGASALRTKAGASDIETKALKMT